MPKLIEYQKADSFDPLISWLNRNKPNVKYTLKAEYVKDGRRHEADCGQIIANDPIIQIMYALLTNALYSSGSGVSSPTVVIYVQGNSNNVNSSTSWLSTSYTLNGATSGNFSITFSTTISSTVSGTATVENLIINFLYGKNSSGTANTYSFGVSTQSGTACNINVSAGNVITWTLSGQVKENNTNATDSWYVYLWNEIWAEFIAATGVSNAPTGLWIYPSSSGSSLSPLFNYYDITLLDSSGNTIGAYNVPLTSNTAISNPKLMPGNSGGFSTAPGLSFTFTPTSNDTLQTVESIIYVYGTGPSTPYTQFATVGGLELRITNINQPVSAGQQYSITVQDNVSVSQST